MSPISVVIPAHNEEAVIRRCLHALLDRSEPGELEVIVVCNGCSDRTADLARSFSGSVQVIEVPEASKPLALNAGDGSASFFPRFFVDADVELEIESLRQVASLLDNSGQVLAAAPRLRVDLSGCSRWVKSWYRLWMASSYLAEHHIGSGVFALSEAGRARFDDFPPLIADDLFVHHLFAPGERETENAAAFTVHAPRTVRALLHRRVRVRAGTLQLHRNMSSSPGATTGVLGVVLRRPALVTSLPVYLTVGILANARAGRKLASGRAAEWERDDTSRGASA
jgi:glycosyltransferase involved in cell wall biosynthesis